MMFVLSTCPNLCLCSTGHQSIYERLVYAICYIARDRSTVSCVQCIAQHFVYRISVISWTAVYKGGRLIIYMYLYIHYTQSWVLFDQIDLCLFVFFCIDLLSIAIYGQYNGNNFLHRHQVSRVILEIYLSLSHSLSVWFSLFVYANEWLAQLQDISMSLRFQSIQISRKKEHNFGSSVRLSHFEMKRAINQTSIVPTVTAVTAPKWCYCVSIKKKERKKNWSVR